MKVREGMESEYAQYVTTNSEDPYSARCVSYGAEWADLMETAIRTRVSVTGETVEQVIAAVAKDAGRTADTDGITGFMYGAAVAGLARFWEHGEALRRWHNIDTQLGTEGERANAEGGTLNPAILTIGTGGD
jgi:hypothetical protein